MRKYYSDIFINNNGFVNIFDPDFGPVYKSKVLMPYINTIDDNSTSIVTEIHLYSTNGDLIKSIINSNLEIDPESRYLMFDIRSALLDSNISTGSYKIVFNVFLDILGSYTNKTLKLVDISPDRTEIKVKYEENKSSILEYLYNSYLSQTLTQHVINFGSNNIYNVINYRYDSEFIYFKLYNSLDDDIAIRDTFNLSFEVMDPYYDSIIITHNIVPLPSNKLKPPRFDIDTDQIDSNSTIYKAWEDLLSSDSITSQNIIDKLFNVDESVTLNIDFTNFSNYIFYSKAKRRIEIFYEKVLMINQYNIEINEIENTNNTGEYIILDVDTRYDLIEKIKQSFDAFERWLYYNSDEDIFTHGLLGPVKPYPKVYISNVLNLKPVDDSSVLSWYNTMLTLAEEYDLTNNNSLQWSIPEHILMDENNSEYILFVDMISHHFDNVYLYVKALTSIHENDEHLERGAPNELLYNIAKSFGWNLQNSRVLTDLWLYKDTKEQDGTDVVNIDSHEKQTQQIWKRIVNNIPYLYKTKGTGRSVEALMSIYGIPKTLISIKEYGGPGLTGDVPILTEERFYYKLRMFNDRYLTIPQSKVLAGVNRINEPDSDNLTNLLLNGDFSAGGLNWIVDAGTLTLDDPGNGGLALSVTDYTMISQSISITSGIYYAISFEIYDITDGAVQLYVGSDPIGPQWTTVGKHIYYYVATSTGISAFKFEVMPNTDTITIGDFNIYTEDEYFRYPDTYEFRFQINNIEPNIDYVLLRYIVDTDPDAFYGFRYKLTDSGNVDLIFETRNILQTVFEELPLNNEEFWTISIERGDYTISYADQVHDLTIRLGCAKDYGYEKVTHFYEETFSVLGIFQISSNLDIRLGGSFESYDAFNGWINGYKEYFGRYSNDVFKQHVLNPNSYTVDDFHNVYDSLYRYLPLGLDIQRNEPDVDFIVPSSQPNRDLIVPDSVGTGFSSVSESENYDYTTELFYIVVPKIGGRTVQSQKIRIEDVNLQGNLTPDRRRSISQYDLSNLDSNRLAIVYSLADQINRDISDHIGLANLDIYIGDPDYEDDVEYCELRSIRHEYFKKYQQINNINAFIKIFSVYDYSFFEQLKQLIPARANLITGILIEPHILERNKVIIAKRPKINLELLEDTVDLNIYNQFSDIYFKETNIDINTVVKTYLETLKGNIPANVKLSMLIEYLKGVIPNNTRIETKFEQLRATLTREFNLKDSEIFLSAINNGIVNVRNFYYGTSGTHEYAIDEYRKNCKYKIKRPVYGYYANETNYIDNHLVYSNVTIVGPITRDTLKLQDLIDLEIFISNEHPQYKHGIIYTGSGTPGTIEFKTSIAVTGSHEYELVWAIVNLDPAYSADIIIDETSEGVITLTDISMTNCTSADPILVREYSYRFTNLPDVLPTIKISKASGNIVVFKMALYEYKTKWEREVDYYFNRDNNRPEYFVLDETNYQYTEYNTEDNKRFLGSKISGAGFNINSEETIDKGPVVEFRDVSPSILKNANSSGNLTVD